MYYRNQSTSRRLIFAAEAISIAQSDLEIGTVLSKFGYPPEELAQGMGIYENAKRLLDMRKAGLGEQIIATSTLNEAYRSVRFLLQVDRRFVRILLRDRPDEHESLGVRGVLKRAREELVLQAQFFYDVVLADESVLADLEARFNLTRDVLERHQQGVADFAAAMQVQQEKLGDTTERTRRRRVAMAELDEWMSRFIGVARQAFRGEVGKLKKLGLTVR